MGTFLHGTLRVTVVQARDLLDCDTTFGFNLVSKNYSDPDCKISMLCSEELDLNLGKTTRIDNDLNPVWHESFVFYICHNVDKLKFTLRDKDHTSVSDYLGRIFVEADKIARTDESSDDYEPIEEEWFDLETQGALCVTVKFTPKNQEKVREVESYFPVMEGNKVTLYQDAETPMLPCFEGVTNADGSQYEPTNCWKDLYKHICEAEKFIYITGWSVCINTSLLRDDEDAIAQSKVGELLKGKAEEGLSVIVVVWDERTSNAIIPGGFMGTHDEETFTYFADTNVQCFKHPRHQGGQAMGVKGMFRTDFTQTCYSHHQKTVILDAPGGVDDTRRIIAFVGGLDITDGRYDTPEFHLWSTLSTRHNNCGDFYNNCTPGTTAESGPRQPWHDIHAKIEGPAAAMVRQNFVERVMQQSESASTGILSIVDFDADSEAIPEESDGALWNVQLFRSITSESAIFDLDSAQGLHLNKGLYCENSIFRAYVQQIRNAQNYIYVENQYFLGSSFDWTDSKDAAANHTIPAEIAFKVRDKIAAGEPFAAYIVIPMYPEGDPSTAALQEILYWQHRTMQMMYKTVADAIKEHGAEGKPDDYLMFFCLAKREGINDIPEDVGPPTEGTKAELVRMTMRHPIYVHCKMLIVDDDYIIVGSANINQRSLGGNRDSEIAIGAWQPGYTTEEMDGEPRGAVHTFRMALWAAHLGGVYEEILNPASSDCVKKVQEISTEYWDRYKEEDPEHEDVKLLRYPVNIDEDGIVSALEEPFNCFPDTAAPILGNKSNYMPPKLTT